MTTDREKRLESANKAAKEFWNKVKAAADEYEQVQASLEGLPGSCEEVLSTLTLPGPRTKPEHPSPPPTRTIQDSLRPIRKEERQNKLGKLYEQRRWTIEVADNLEALYGDLDPAVNFIIASIRQYADDLILRNHRRD